MNEINFPHQLLAGSGGSLQPQHPHDRHAILWRQASQLFMHSFSAGQAGRFWSRLFRPAARLYDLNRLGCPPSHQHYAGLKTVAISQIRGSEGRCTDFDPHFHPLSWRLRDRWMRVALAMLQGTALPAVELIQVGDIYFVRDGHHRISAAQAWGQDFIDAEVTVWEVPHPLPWEQAVPAVELPAAMRNSPAL